MPDLCFVFLKCVMVLGLFVLSFCLFQELSIAQLCKYLEGIMPNNGHCMFPKFYGRDRTALVCEN